MIRNTKPKTYKPCPECCGDGGRAKNESRPVGRFTDWDNGEEYKTNWIECYECGGTGEVETEEEE